jgi:hypothetical protein
MTNFDKESDAYYLDYMDAKAERLHYLDEAFGNYETEDKECSRCALYERVSLCLAFGMLMFFVISVALFL